MPTSTNDENAQDYVGAGVHRGSASGLVAALNAQPVTTGSNIIVSACAFKWT